MNPLLLQGIFNIVGRVFDALDPAKKAEAQLEVMRLQQAGEFKALEADMQLALGQLDINKAEAASGNSYASGWRPTIGYICALGLAYNFIVYPFLLWFAAVYKPGFQPPPLLSDNLMELVLGMLGLAGFRTYEKVKGSAK